MPDTLLLQMAAVAPPDDALDQTSDEGDADVKPPPPAHETPKRAKRLRKKLN
jgi:hypothetical protein